MENGNQLYVNNKWFWDIIETDQDKTKIRVKYKENINSDFYQYKTISVPTRLLNCKQTNNILICTIDEIELKKVIGSLINRFVKELNVYEIFENVVSAGPANSGGMGSVSVPSMSGVAGVPGSSGSGDVSGHVVFGLEKIPVQNLKGINTLLKDKKKKRKTVLKNPVLNVIKENNEIIEETDNQYKLKVYEFLDYPRNSDFDIEVIKSISKHRDQFKSISIERIQKYFKSFYELNKTAIENKGSEQLQNQLLALMPQEL